MLFLDHTLDGSRIIGETEFHRAYGNRAADVAVLAKPLTAEGGKRLHRAALEAIQNSDKTRILGLFSTDFGPFGDAMVCSEKARWAVGKASGLPIQGKKAWGVDISPGDFYDKETGGKYFVISPLKPTPEK